MKARLTAGSLLLIMVIALVATSCGGGYRTCATYSKNTAPVVHKGDKAS